MKRAAAWIATGYAVVLLVVLLRAGEWAAAHWWVLYGAAVVLVALALGLRQRYRLAELRERYSSAGVGEGPLSSFARITPTQTWPKKCLFCMVPVWSWHDAGVHMIACYGSEIDTPKGNGRPGSDWKVEPIDTSGEDEKDAQSALESS